MTEKLIDIMEDISKKLKIRTLSYEYEIATCLIDFETMTPHQLINYSTASSTAFYNTLSRMESRGVIHSEMNPHDKRSKLYRIDDQIRDLIISRYNKYRSSRIDSLHNIDFKKNEVNDFSEEIKSGKYISHLTCNYQIILYLHIQSGITNLQFVDIVDVSPTKFNSSLKELLDMGIIYYEIDGRDKRSKLYYLKDDVKKMIDEVHERVFKWLDSRPHETVEPASAT